VLGAQRIRRRCRHLHAPRFTPPMAEQLVINSRFARP
jgi:hypothetical protein